MAKILSLGIMFFSLTNLRELETNFYEARILFACWFLIKIPKNGP